MSAEVPRLFVFARHAESTANTAYALSSDPARPVALTERGRAQAKGPDDASRRYANALRSLLARTEAVTLVVLHESALREIALVACAGGSPLPAGAVGSAIPFLFDEHAAGRAATRLHAIQPRPGLPPQGQGWRARR